MRGYGVSVVVITRNRAEVAQHTIDRLLQQEGVDFEIIVVDQIPVAPLGAALSLAEGPQAPATRDASSPLQSYCLSRSTSLPARSVSGGQTPCVRYVSTPVANPSRARNIGVLLAKYPVVLFCDDDAEPLAGLLQAHSAVYAESRVAGVAGAVLSPSQVASAQPGADSQSGMAKVDAGYAKDCGGVGCRLPGDVSRRDACNLSFRRDVLLDVNGFNSQFGNGPAPYEDLELCLRIKKRGWCLAFEPSAAVVHEQTPWRGSLWSYARWVYWRFKYRAAIFCRHLNLIGLPVFPFLEFLRLLALKRGSLVTVACGLAGTALGLLEGLPDILDRLLAVLGLEFGRCDYGDLDKVVAEYGLMMVA